MKTGKSIEILAPCGNIESFEAAVNAGADAVYTGLKRFSARGNADNFDLYGEDFKRVITYSRACGIKVYIALNTLVFDDEFELLREYIHGISEYDGKIKGVINGIIVQDLGVANVVREINPRIPLHASTQMTVTSVSAAKQLKDLGFSRVVLARELQREEIGKIVRESGIETEVFVHGAHCASVSGQCYMSCLLGGSIARSGNRGMCAQPCRLDFRGNYGCNNRNYALSLKDLSLIPHIGELREMGVASIKIEGRMKRPEYVFAAVDACRKALSGETPDMELLERIFSRGGFTDGYYTGNYSDMRGIRSKADVTATKQSLNQIQKRIKTPYKRYTVDFHLRITEDKPSECSATVGGRTVTVTGAIPEKALTKPVTSEMVQYRMAKLGGTVYTAGKIECEIDPGLTLKAAEINELRRKSLLKLDGEGK